MAYLTLTKQTVTPATPTTGKVRFFFTSSGNLSAVDDTGNVSVFAAGLTQEQVEDYVGSLLQDSASIDVTYNDEGSAVTFTVLAGGVNHNALLNYVANQHVDHSTVSISAGTGLTGGGNITTSRTLSLTNTAVTAASYGSASQVATFTVDAQGRLTAASSTPISITASAVSDFTEAVEGAVGGNFVDSATVDFVYDELTDTRVANVIPGGVNHNALLNYVANEHVNHASVSISAGTGLTGGGDITANRTISMPNTGTAGTYRSVTTDAQGRVTAGTNPTTLTDYGITDAQPLDSDLTALASLAGTGLIVRTGTGTAITRVLTAGTGISLSNADGVSGNPTITSTILPYTDEEAQDAVGNILTDSASIDFTYNDGAGTITAAVLPAGVNHNALQNYVDNQHVDHSGISITAGTGLSGGGDITASRTLNIADTGVTAGTYGSAAAYPIITVNAQGQLTTVTTASVPGGGLYARTTGALTNSSNVTFVNIPELSITLAANTIYRVHYQLIGQSVINTTGLAFALNGGTIVPVSTRGYWETTTVASTINRTNFTLISSVVTFSGVSTANTDQLINSAIVIVTDGTGGTLIPQFRSEVSASAVTVQANSFVTAEVLP
jgi:phage-related tail fiber protein